MILYDLAANTARSCFKSRRKQIGFADTDRRFVCNAIIQTKIPDDALVCFLWEVRRIYETDCRCHAIVG